MNHRLKSRTATTRLLALSFLLATTGCFDMQSDIYVEKDGSGRADVGYAITKSILKGGPFDEYLAKDGSGEILDKNLLLKKIDDRPGISVNGLDLWQKDDLQYIRMKVEFDDVANLGDRDVSYSWSIEDGTWVFRIIITKDRTKTPDSRVHQALMRGMQEQGFHFKVHLPDRIIDSNADEVHWNVAEFFVPVTFFFQNQTATRVLYARVEASTWERVKAWFSDLVPS